MQPAASAFKNALDASEDLLRSTLPTKTNHYYSLYYLYRSANLHGCVLEKSTIQARHLFLRSHSVIDAALQNVTLSLKDKDGVNTSPPSSHFCNTSAIPPSHLPFMLKAYQKSLLFTLAGGARFTSPWVHWLMFTRACEPRPSCEEVLINL